MVRSVVDAGLSYAAAARKFNTTPKTVAKWVERFRSEGVDGLRDRSSRPLSSDSQTPRATCDAIEALRRQRYTGIQIAAEVGVSPATVSSHREQACSVFEIDKQRAGARAAYIWCNCRPKCGFRRFIRIYA